MGLEPTNLLTASHILGVREGSASAATSALPGTIVQSGSDPFSGIRPRCLHNCLHLKSARLPASRVRRGRSRPVRVVDRCGSRVSRWRCQRTVRRGARYPGSMAAQPVMTAEEWFEGMRQVRPPTPDDVTILWDGRRLDSREAALEWLAEVAAKRAEEAIGADGRS